MHPSPDEAQAPAQPAPAAPQLVIAIVISTLGATVVGFETAGVYVPVALRSALLASAVLVWSVYLYTRYDERTQKRLDRLEEMLDARLKKAGYAEGFVDGARRELPPPVMPSLRPVAN